MLDELKYKDNSSAYKIKLITVFNIDKKKIMQSKLILKMLNKLLLFVSVFINCLKFVLYLIFSLYVNVRLVDDQVMYQWCKNDIY